MEKRELTFEAPGPGSWSFARSHQTSPFPRLVVPMWEARYPAGFRRGFREIGALLDTLEVRCVHGWFYIRARPVGAPEKATKPPPAFIFKLLVRVHPEIRRRLARAEEAWSTRPWRKANQRWRDETSPAFRSRLIALQTTSIGAEVTDAQLLAHIREVFVVYGDVVEEHFAISSQTVPAMGELFVRAESFGIRPHEVMPLLTGASPETTRPREHGLAI